MKVHIPETREKLTLAKDWTITLEASGINARLGNAYGHNLNQFGWSKGPIPNPPVTPNIDWPRINDFRKKGFFSTSTDHSAYNKAIDEAKKQPLYLQYEQDKRDWENAARALCVRTVTITIPAGTVLTVDNIHIRRKWLSKQRSTATFYVGLGNSNPRLRVSLDEANQIETV